MQSPAKLYSRIWRWHFFAGLLCAPVLLIVSVTGAIYVYQSDWEPALAPGLFYSPGALAVGFAGANPTAGQEKAGEERSVQLADALTRQLAAAQKAAAGEPAAVLLPGAAGRSNIFMFKSGPGLTQEVFVNPVTEKVQGSRIREKSFFSTVIRLHRDLMLGLPGRFLVELATSWAVILIITGLYLWWPRGTRRTAGVYWLRIRTKFRIFNRDLHAVSGFYFSVFIFIFVVTGLVYSPVLGTIIKRPIVMIDTTTQKIFKRVNSQPSGGQRVHIGDVARHIKVKNIPGQTTVLFYPRRPNSPDKAGDGFMVMHRPGAGFAGGQMVFVDQTSGQLIERVRLADAKPLTKALFEVYPIHIGAIFGEPTKLIAFITCIVLAVAAVGGVLMWWLRRPKGSWGFPARAKERGLMRWVRFSVIFLSILFPMVGLTVLVIIGYGAIARRVKGRRE